jgi:hypothetical protein
MLEEDLPQKVKVLVFSVDSPSQRISLDFIEKVTS